MKDLVFDINRLLGYLFQQRIPTGIDRVCLEYARYFRNNILALMRFAGRWVIFDQKISRNIIDALLASDKNYYLQLYSQLSHGYIFSRFNHTNPHLLINPSESGLEQLNYVTQINKRNLKPLFFLHDLIPITHPQYCLLNEEMKHRRRLDTILSVGRGVVTNSIAVRDEFQCYAQAQGRSLPPIVVAPLAASQMSKPAINRPIKSLYFVLVGTIEPRKNHLMLLNLWQQLIVELGDKAPKLVIIGKRGWNIKKVTDILDNCPIIRGFVIEKPNCDDNELSTWLYYAQASLFPTFTEGFGIPLHEALTLKVPVIASDIPVFHETACNIPEYLNPQDTQSWRQMILDYIQPNSVYREAQCERIKLYDGPTWVKHFHIVEEFIKKLT